MGGTAAHSSTIALAQGGRLAWVVQPDGDSISVVDVEARALVREVALGPTPAVDAAGRYVPAVAPRAVAIAARQGRAFVSGERSGEVIALDTVRMEVAARARVCARPVGVVVTADEGAVLVACAADDVVVALDPRSLRERARVAVGPLPWALALDPDPRRAHVAHFHGPGVTTLTLAPLAVAGTLAVPEVAPRGHRILAHGAPRSLYDLAVRPGARPELWVAHELHASDTPQPELDFESTVFPALTVMGPGGRTLTTDSRLANRPGVRDGEFGDVVSGPRALAFTPDGRFALVVDQGSEDVLVVDAERGVEADLVRPLPGDLPQGIALAPDGRRAYVDARNSGEVVVLALAPAAHDGLEVRVDGAPIAARARDPMPPVLRLGQRVFYTANDAEIPVTTNHWLSCASCHPEGTTDRVTYAFTQGPRNTPSNAGGPDGFLFRTAARRDLTEYWRTIDVEQGGHFLPDDQVLAPYLHALAAYVQSAIPVPPPPTTDPARVARGRAVFARADVQCATCHAGPHGTDSGQGNPGLDLAGPVLLHDVGTCVQDGPHPDRTHEDFAGHPRGPCAFDTPALRGLAESAPYLHDGSAATLRDVLTTRNVGDRHGRTSHLRPDEIDDLVEYLRSL